MLEMLTIKQTLRKAVLEYKQDRPNLSLRAIAKYSGVNRYFLSKILDEADQTINLDLNQVLILTKYITGKDSLTEAVDSSTKEIRASLMTAFEEDLKSHDKIIHSQLFENLDLYDKYTYFVLVLASYSKGTKIFYVEKIFGEKGRIALEELLLSKIIIEENGRIKLSSGDDFTYDFKILIKHIPEYLEHYRITRSHTKENFLHIVSEGLNKKGLKELHKIHKSTYKKIAEVMANPEYFGDIPVFSFSCLDRLIESTDDVDDKNNS